MKRRRLSFEAEEEAELWRHWRDGRAMIHIAKLLTRNPSSIQSVVYAAGGFPPRPRRRRQLALSPVEREEISRGLSAGASVRAIARGLQRPPSTVSREICRNGGRDRYRATKADARASSQSRRPKPCKLASHAYLRRVVGQKLWLDWSPEQISGWLKKRFPDDIGMHVSHETIYRSLFVQARNVLKRELTTHLRSRRRHRRSAKSDRSCEGRGQIVDAISIRERPAEAEDRAVPGHWEGDLISGSKNTHIATLVERRSRFVLLVKLTGGKQSSTVVAAIARAIRKLPAELRRSLAWDRGGEMAQHKTFSIATDVKVYFCDPRSPWQRGSNENTNGLLRQYFPKATDLSQHSQAKLNTIANRLNNRPRKTLGFRTPGEVFNEALR
jgi:IS30 family transposase